MAHERRFFLFLLQSFPLEIREAEEASRGVTASENRQIRITLTGCRHESHYSFM